MQKCCLGVISMGGAFIFLILLSSPLMADVRYTVNEELLKYKDSFAMTAMNDRGEIVGFRLIGEPQDGRIEALLWTQGKGLQPLMGPNNQMPRSEAIGINNLGQIVGVVTLSGEDRQRAVIWTRAGDGYEWRLIDDGGSVNSIAYDINDAGTIVGMLSFKGSFFDEPQVFLKKLNAQLQILGDIYWSVRYINQKGQVSGIRDSLNFNPMAFIYDTESEQITELGTLGGEKSIAFGLNNLGEVVGSSELRGSTLARAFIYSDGLMMDLGQLSPTYDISTAYDINDKGEVVGNTVPSTNGRPERTSRAFYYHKDTGMVDLNTLVQLPDPTWRLSWASVINNWGQILSWFTREDGDQGILLLDPILPFLPGDCNADNLLDISDALKVLKYLFQGDAEPEHPDACDADGNDTIQISDAVYILNFLFRGGLPPVR